LRFVVSRIEIWGESIVIDISSESWDAEMLIWDSRIRVKVPEELSVMRSGSL